MRFFKVLLLIVGISLFTVACGSGGDGGSDDNGGNIELSGTWNFYHTENGGAEQDDGLMITSHSGNNLSVNEQCGNIPWTVFSINGDNVNTSWQEGDETISLTGTTNSDKTGISGTWNDTSGDSGTWRMAKISNSITPTSNGSLVVSGNLCGQAINLNTAQACGEKDYDNGTLDDIEINAAFNNGSIGIELENPDILASNSTYTFGTTTTQQATITVDGISNDWATLTPAISDSQEGDSQCAADADIKSVYTAMDSTYAYVMVETYGTPIDSTATLELNFDYKAGQHFTHGPLDDLHTNFGSNTLSAWNDNDLDGNMESYAINGYTVTRGTVMEARIPLSQIENAAYFNPTFVNIWSGGVQNGCDPTNSEFEIDFQGDIVETCNSDNEITASSGTITVDIYDGSHLKGNFDIIVDGNNITGSFDVQL